MSKLTFKKMSISAVDINGESSLPSIAKVSNVQQKTNTDLDEGDELFIGYGFVNNVFPYSNQDLYNRDLKEKNIDVAILENENLKAVFLTSLGGRLWSLFDKNKGHDLLYTNPVIRFGNLALRNAWFSGGVEWNFGMVGHSPFTCSPLFVATLNDDDGTPILRMYEYERIRGCTYQMDFFLPKDSKNLFCSMRIVNPTTETLPIYWWSNTAVPEKDGARIVVPANKAYTINNETICKVNVPIDDGIDITYSTNMLPAKDHFWVTKNAEKKYICQINKDGYGLVQTSTRRLKGRKLFVWGQGKGSHHWQDFLSRDGEGNYVEIQSGLGQAQYECLPMPPKTSWEWIETYGAIEIDPSKAHGDWQIARNEIEKAVDTDALEKLLEKTKITFSKNKADNIISCGSGWGALESLRREINGEKPMSEHLDFGGTQQEQKQWVSLMIDGSMGEVSPEKVPSSWINQKEFIEMLQKAVQQKDKKNWYTWMQLGITEIANENLKEAKKALITSLKLNNNAWSLYGLACIAIRSGKKKLAATFVLDAFSLQNDNISLIKETLRILADAEMYNETLKLISTLPKALQIVGRVKLYQIKALIYTDQLQEADELLNGNCGLELPDVREGDVTLSDIWFDLEEKKAISSGKIFDKNNTKPPRALDFRMSLS